MQRRLAGPEGRLWALSKTGIIKCWTWGTWYIVRIRKGRYYLRQHSVAEATIRNTMRELAQYAEFWEAVEDEQNTI